MELLRRKALRFFRKSCALLSLLDEACFFKGHVSAILIDGLERARTDFNSFETPKFWNPDAFVLKVWRNRAFYHLGDVTSDSALFLGQT